MTKLFDNRVATAICIYYMYFLVVLAISFACHFLFSLDVVDFVVVAAAFLSVLSCSCDLFALLMVFFSLALSSDWFSLHFSLSPRHSHGRVFFSLGPKHEMDVSECNLFRLSWIIRKEKWKLPWFAIVVIVIRFVLVKSEINAAYTQFRHIYFFFHPLLPQNVGCLFAFRQLDKRH